MVLAEKPSVARDIARVLGAGERGDGFLAGGGYLVTWAVGHLVTLKEPDEMDPRLKKWRRADLPILPERMETKVIPQTKKQFSVVKRLLLAADTDGVICATDSGREGELIFRYIYEMAGCNKPVRRLWISSMTDEAIREGFRNLRPSADYDALYRSARCRADADWLIGMNASRAYTLRYQVLLSIGRVQTPTLSMLVKRRREIDSFRPEAYFTVQADFGDYTGFWQDADGERKIPEKQQAEAVAARVRGKEGEVCQVSRERKAERPPLLYDLTSLQRDANALYGYTAKKTLELAQKLYETHKLLTYPRTDSRYLSHDMLGRVETTLRGYAGPLEAAGRAALSCGVRPLSRVFDDAKLTDHHAIIPTGKSPARLTLTAEERNVYEMAARRLAAVFCPDYQYEAVRILTKVGEDAFVSTGRTVLEEGWKALSPVPARGKKKETEEQQLPALSEGDRRICKTAKVKEDKTKPPKELTDASLLSGMEHAGREIEDEALREEMKDCALGTPATRAAIIERLIAVGYAARKGKTIVATEKGARLIDAVPREISSPETTGRWEKALAQIARGEDMEARFREGIRRLASFLVESADRAADVAFPAEERRSGKGKKSAPAPLGACPLCRDGGVYENSKSFFCSRYREGCKFTIWKDALVRSGGPELTGKLMRLCLANKQVRGSTGTIFLEDGKIRFERNGTRGGEADPARL